MLFRDVILAVAGNATVRGLATGFPAFRRMARRFVAGETLDEGVTVAAGLKRAGLAVSLDHLGESVTDETMARQAAADYVAALDRIAADGLSCHVSVKLTQLGLDLGKSLCLGNMHLILDRALHVGTFVRIDMEASSYTDRTLEIYRDLRADYGNVGVVIQASLRRSLADVTALASAGASVRLCKGAYSEPPAIAFPDKRDVDENYRRLLEVMLRPESLAAGARVAVATHDEKLIAWARDYAGAHNIPPSAFEFQMLYGIRRDLQRDLAAQGFSVRVYVPYGTHWYPYLTRRLAERPANLLFIGRAMLRG